MRVLMVIGIVLILVGIAGLAVNYVLIPHGAEVARIGSLKAAVNERKDIFIPPYASVIVAGPVLVGARRRVSCRAQQVIAKLKNARKIPENA